MEGAGGGVQERVKKLPSGFTVETSGCPSWCIAAGDCTTRYDAIQKHRRFYDPEEEVKYFFHNTAMTAVKIVFLH